MLPTHQLTHTISHEFPLHEIQPLAVQYNLIITYLNPLGPEGGNPEVTLSGSRENLLNYLKDYSYQNRYEIMPYCE